MGCCACTAFAADVCDERNLWCVYCFYKVREVLIICIHRHGRHWWPVRHGWWVHPRDRPASIRRPLGTPCKCERRRRFCHHEKDVRHVQTYAFSPHSCAISLRLRFASGATDPPEYSWLYTVPAVVFTGGFLAAASTGMAGLVQAGYLTSSILCIGSLSGLGSQATARQGNILGILGVSKYLKLFSSSRTYAHRTYSLRYLRISSRSWVRARGTHPVRCSCSHGRGHRYSHRTSHHGY